MSRHAILVVGCVLFLAWFLMKFHMDNSNDSETQAYVAGLLARAANHSIAGDANGHYAALAPYVMWPFATALQHVTGAYLIRGLVFALFFVSLLLNAAAYAWYRTLGLTWLTSLFGLVLLSTSVAFAMQYRESWELEKWIEPALFLLAGIAAWKQRWIAFVAIAVLAAANRDTGLFVPLVGVFAPRRDRLVSRWPIIVALILSLTEVTVLWRLGPTPNFSPFIDLNANRLVYVLGGICLLPLLALVWARRTSLAGMRWLLYSLTPVWLLIALATDRIELGAVLLAPLALLWVPVALDVLAPVASVEQSRA